MLTTTYKVISKVLLKCLKPMVPSIVDQCQTSFVMGHCIIDNILALKLGQEHVVATKKDIIFMKLDFEKAFDWVYLWATLVAMKMDPFVINLIKGLVIGVHAKVHVNNLFTWSFPLKFGVHQGDPMSPLLFVISSQTLLSLVESKCAQGVLKGLHINERSTLLYQLFADDANIFLRNF